MNRYEAEARADKAQKLARWLARNGYVPEQVFEWSQDQWDIAAGMAGVRSPSELTTGIVIGLLVGDSKRKGKVDG